MQCGPAPVKAIKEGNIYLNYDCKFIFGEVNGDELHWTVDGDTYTLKKVIEDSDVGSKTSTKAVGSNRRNDIQYDYKYMKGLSLIIEFHLCMTLVVQMTSSMITNT